MRIALALLLLSAAAGGAAVAKASDPSSHPADFVLPGWWETTNRMTAPWSSEKTEHRCVTPTDVIKFMQPCNHHFDCQYSTQEIAGGHITLKGQWVGKKDGQVVNVAGRGEYTPETLHATAEMHTHFLGLPLSGRAETDARRISAECPAPGADKH